MSPAPPLPVWADRILLPLVCLAVALACAGGVVWLVGQSPVQVMGVLLEGAFGSQRGWCYVLYYATTFVFTGLAVAVAFHGGLFNIGGEGQAVMGGLATGLIALWLSPYLPWWLMLPLMVLAGAVGGAMWAAVPGYLQAYRGSHIVITTIMFNFIAASLLVYVMVNLVRAPGSMAIESAPFAASAKLPSMQTAMEWLGVDWVGSPLNLSVFLALVASAGVYLFLWHSRSGYQLRVVGASPGAAQYAGIAVPRQVVTSMALSGALAGMVGMNEISGVSGRLLLEFVSGAGFTGIGVALMGRNHPVGIVLASVLFGALFQGGAEVSFEVPGFGRDMVVMLQGFIVLFSGAMTYAIAPWVSRALVLGTRWMPRRLPGAAKERERG